MISIVMLMYNDKTLEIITIELIVETGVDVWH